MIARPLSRAGTPAIAVAGAAGGALVIAVLARRVGPVPAVALPAAAIGALLLLANARAAVLLAVAAPVLAEGAPQWGIPLVAKIYENTPVFFTPSELLLLLALAAVIVDAVRRHEGLRLPAAILGPLCLAVAAVAFGLVMGHYAGADVHATRSFFETATPLFLVPVLVVNVVRSRDDLRRALGLGGALAVGKAALGLGALVAGLGVPMTFGGPRITYYEPTANLLLLAALLTVVAAKLAGVPMPRWLTWGSLLIVACLLLSYRRTFWIATVLCVALVAVIAGGRVGRRLLVPVLVIVGLSGWLVVQSGVVGDLQGPIVARAQSISPSKVKRNQQDRYRLDERRNVMAEIRRHPLTGLGIGVPYAIRYPLAFEVPGLQQYVHFAFLWWWLKMGLIGAISYVWLVLSSIVIGLRVWRRHPDGVVRAFGLGAGIAGVGLAVIELAATVLGPDFRGTTLFGALLGLLAVAAAQLHRPEPAATAASIDA